jgi:transposase
MALIDLSPKDRALLEGLADSTDQAKQLLRTQALLWLDEGESALEVAERLRVSRQTVYNWVDRFRRRGGTAFEARLADGPRTGRPPTAQGLIDPLVLGVIGADPQRWGYQATVWTAPLLRRYLEDFHQIAVSQQSVRLAIDRLGISWKRPRHQLASRPDTWRQAKGGSNAASAPKRGPSC